MNRIEADINQTDVERMNIDIRIPSGPQKTIIRMKQTVYILIALIIASCEPPKEEVRQTIISGHIINPVGETVTFKFSNADDIVDSLDTENKFSTELNLSEPTEITFNHGNEHTFMYVRPGDSLSLTLNTEAFDESLKYTGIGSEINNYKAALMLLGDSVMSIKSMCMLPEDSFLLAIDSIENMKLDYIADFGISDEYFIAHTKLASKWDIASKKMNYPSYHKYLTKNDSFQVSDAYYSFQDDLNINDTSLIKMRPFKGYVNWVAKKLTSEIYEQKKSDSIDYYDANIIAIDSLPLVDAVKEMLLFDLITNYYSYLKPEKVVYITTKWKTTNPSDEHIQKVDELVAKWSKIAAGQPAPGFTYVNLEGDSVSLSDFRGKLVYIDVWATWCGPCIAEHPSMEKLQEKFKEDDVIFIAVSTDRSQEPWKKMVAEKGLGGIHLWAPNAWKASIMQDYMIRGIPRFILIDKEGNIVDANAKRPSGKIAEQIEALLNPA